MGASGSTRRIIVEEDDNQGAFLVQVSDSVTKQIIGVKEPAFKVSKKPIEPIHKAVEGVPDVKPALPLQAFPAIPLEPPPSPLDSPKIATAAAAATIPKLVENADEKLMAGGDAAAAAPAIVETKVKTPTKPVPPKKVEAAAAAPPIVSSVDEPLPASQEEKPVRETLSSTPPEASAVAATAEALVTQSPLPPPKIPESALLQLLAPTPTQPTEPETPAPKVEVPSPKKEIPAPKKEAPVQKKEAPVLKKEAPAPKKEVSAPPKDEALPAPVPASDKTLLDERDLLYKQMGEVYQERDKAFKAIENLYREKMNALQNQSTKMHSATRQEFNKAVEEVEKKFLKHVESPVCEDLQLKVLDCYRVNKAYPLKCSAEVQAFSSAVDQARQNVILAKKG